MATGRFSTKGAARSISDVDAALAAQQNADLTAMTTEQIGGVGGVTTEPCHGFVHVKLTGNATTDIDNANAAVAIADFIPGESAQA